MTKRPYIIDRRKGVKAGQSEMELSVLVRGRLGIDVAPDQLRKFVCDQFTSLSILCHEIHEAGRSMTLADKVEKTGPCRETDGLIYRSIDPVIDNCWKYWSPAQLETIVPRYTASLDAAMTLLPEGVWYCLSGPHSATGGLYKGGGQRFDMTMGIGDDRSDGEAATAPNAVVAAALRYRSALEASHG